MRSGSVGWGSPSSATPASTAADKAARDATYTPSEAPGAFERFARSLINDPRDVPFVRFSAVATLLVVPAAGALFYLRSFSWWLGAAYLAIVMLFFTDRYILMLHNTSHRKLFKLKWNLLNQYIPSVLGPLFGGLVLESGTWRDVFWLFAGQSAVFSAAAPFLLRGSLKAGGGPASCRSTAPAITSRSGWIIAGART